MRPRRRCSSRIVAEYSQTVQPVGAPYGSAMRRRSSPTSTIGKEKVDQACRRRSSRSSSGGREGPGEGGGDGAGDEAPGPDGEGETGAARAHRPRRAQPAAPAVAAAGSRDHSPSHLAARVMPITTMMQQAMAVAALASQAVHPQGAARGVAPVAAATPGTAPAKTAPRTALGDARATPLETACERVTSSLSCGVPSLCRPTAATYSSRGTGSPGPVALEGDAPTACPPARWPPAPENPASGGCRCGCGCGCGCDRAARHQAAWA